MNAAATRANQEEHALRDHEASLLQREAELLRAEASLRAEDEGALRRKLEAARGRTSLPRAMAELVRETLEYVEAGPDDLAAEVRGHRLDCLEVEVTTATTWIDAVSTDDLARRMGILHAIKLQLQQRARTLLAWQKTIDDARRRRHMAHQLVATLEAPARPPPLPAAPTFEPDEAGSGVVYHPHDAEEDLAAHVIMEPEGVPSLFPVKISIAPASARASARPRSPSLRPPPETEERRVAPRLPLVEPIAMGDGEHTFFTGLTDNISESGLFVASFQLPLSLGDMCMLEFGMPDGFVVQVEARVCWQRVWNSETPDVVPGFGLKFVGLTADQETRIAAYIAREGSLFYDD